MKADRGVTQKRQGSEPDIMPFDGSGGEFESPLRSKDQDRTVKLVLRIKSFRQRVVIFDVKDGLNRHCSWLAESRPDL
jgi:hypothetical protein